MGLFGAVLGAVAERLERRSALIFVVLAMMASSAAVAILATLGRLEVWHLAAAALVNGLGWATDNPIRRMMIGDAVSSSRMRSEEPTSALQSLMRISSPVFCF